MSVPESKASQSQQPDLDSPSEPSISVQLFHISTPASHIHEPEFQKNYPKNIFIPLIQYLAEVGYKQAYEQCVGCKNDFQGKNVVSLNSIYTLITQHWFQRNINKVEALSHLSNKILINSKIKKKLFHLLIAHLILTSNFIDVKDFKRKVSREANAIGKKKLANDQIFSYPNAIIYLLHLFLKILLFHANKKKGYKLEDEFSKLTLEEASPTTEQKAKNFGSKEEYKFYVKEIVHIFGSKGITSQNYTDILQEVKQTILEKDKLFRQKYQLVEGIPNWIHFIQCVVLRCFESKKKDTKITNFIFNDWITQCKNKMLSINKDKEALPSQDSKEVKLQSQEWIDQNLNFHEKWAAMPLSIIRPPVTDSQQGQQQGESKVKKFSPIIISKLLGKDK